MTVQHDPNNHKVGRAQNPSPRLQVVYSATPVGLASALCGVLSQST